MPLKTSEEKKNALKWLLSQAKIYAIAVAAAGASVWGVAQYYLEDYVKDTATQIIEEKNGNQSFREILGEQLDIPTDIVPYYLTGKITEIDSIESQITFFEESYVPFLEAQMKITVIYRYLDEVGDEWWHGYDDRNYRVNYDNGHPWVVYHGHRKDL